MDTWTRRKFLTASGVAAAGALAAGATSMSLEELLATAGQHLPGQDKDGARDGSRSKAGVVADTLVLVTLYGGNDGLNTVIPAGDSVYRSSRPGLAYSQSEVLPLADGFGLNPAMKGFKALWDAKQLAIVRGVSYPKPDHSHFKSMAIWQTASPSTSVPTGWLGRWLDVHDASPLNAVSLDQTLPPLLAGATTAGATLRLDQARNRGSGKLSPLEQSYTKLGQGAPGEHPLGVRAARSISDMYAIDKMVRDAVAQAEQEGDEGPQDGASAGGQGQLGNQLAVVAACIAVKVPTRVYCVSLGGFDTHSNEKGTQSNLLGQLDTSVSWFLKTVSSREPGKRVVVAIYSEFGRRVKANANQGTDHGTSGPLFVAGTPVKGGFYGDQPSLRDLDRDDLKVTTDFRDVYATLLTRVLATDPARVLPEHKANQLAFL